MAINIGADALFCSGPGFSARALASIPLEDLDELIKYAHAYQRKVFVTLNTIIFDHQLDDVLSYIDTLVSMHVDALIIQDLGLMHILHQRYPTLSLHASTQMNVGNSSAISLIKAHGVDRVVLPRETTLKALKSIKKAVDIEIELFVQGALCTSYSGQCFFSFYRQDGSGNLGSCGQHCRKKMGLNKNPNQYALSLKDLSLQEDVLTLKGLVDSLKIEGRLKSKEYLFGCVRYYRQIVDHQYFDEQMLDLMKVSFNRTYTRGLLKGENGKQLNNPTRINNHGLEIGKIERVDQRWIYIQASKPIRRLDNLRIVNGSDETGLIVETVMKNGQIVQEASGLVQVKKTKQVQVGGVVFVTKTHDHYGIESMSKPFIHQVPIHIEVEAFVGQPLKVKLNHQWYLSEWIIQPAKSAPMTRDAIIQQLQKTKDSAYLFMIDTLTMDEHVFMVKSQLNQFKRYLIEQISKPIPIKPHQVHSLVMTKPSFKGYVFGVQTIDQALVLKQYGITSIYALNLDLLDELSNMFDVVIPVLPRVVKEHQISSYEQKVSAFETVMVSDLGMLSALRGKKDIHASFSFHATNRYVLDWLKDQGVSRVIQSLEHHEDLSVEGIEVMAYVYGRIPLMIMDYCPVNENKGDTCGSCRRCRVKQYHMYDEKNRAYPLIHSGDDLLEIYSDKPIKAFNQKGDYKVIWFSDEDKSQVQSLLSLLD